MGLRDKTLTCRDCGRQFLFTVGDQQFYAQNGFANTPGRCPRCRAARRVSRDGGHKRGERVADVPHDMVPARAAVRQTLSKDSGAVQSRDTYVLRDVMELSYRCEALAAEKARLEREKASLLEKVSLLASERNYLKHTITGFSKSVSIPEKAESLTSHPWWKRILGFR